MNHREICKLKTDFQDAFSLELADVLDQHITGFNLQWNYGNGCFTIREASSPGVTHSRIAIELYLQDIRLLLIHYSFLRKDGGAQKCQNSSMEYDLADPKHSPESIGLEIRDMLDATLPYELVTTDFNV